jgi:hypothetical protein
MKIKEIVTEGLLSDLGTFASGAAQGFIPGLAPNVSAAYQKARDTAKITQGPASLDADGYMKINDPKLAAQYAKEGQLVQTMKQRAVMKNGISVDEIDKLVAQSGKYPDAKQRQAAVNRFVGLLQQQNVNVTDRTLGGTSGGLTKQQFTQSGSSTAPAPAAAAQTAPAPTATTQTAPAASATNAGASMTAKMSAASRPQSTTPAAATTSTTANTGIKSAIGGLRTRDLLSVKKNIDAILASRTKTPTT